MKIFLSMKISPAVKASTNYKDYEHCDHWQKIRTIILSYLSDAFPDKVN